MTIHFLHTVDQPGRYVASQEDARVLGVLDLPTTAKLNETELVETALSRYGYEAEFYDLLPSHGPLV